MGTDTPRRRTFTAQATLTVRRSGPRACLSRLLRGRWPTYDASYLAIVLADVPDGVMDPWISIEIDEHGRAGIQVNCAADVRIISTDLRERVRP